MVPCETFAVGLRLAAALLACWLAGCSGRTENLVSDPKAPAHDAAVSSSIDAATSTTMAATTATTDASVPFPTDAQGHVLCGTRRCQCDDGADNDGDGLVDGFDPECTGPYDDDESSFATGIPGTGNKAKCMGCFFDYNASAQADDCRYNNACLDGLPPGNAGGPMCSTCQPSARCVTRCQPRTPNGCDCFGCCEVKQETGSSVFVRLSDSCSMSKLANTKDCPRCVQSTQCVNDCGPCELCLGRTRQDLDPSCAADGGGLGFACDNHEARCDASTPCPLDYYCHLGCCLPTVF
ncbi:MAG TPA: hypothetical protein VF331_21945 [Polyangiales bacterium]